MARPRAHSGADGPKEPHSVSLKVLRLSRPSLSYQYPLPREDTRISPQASLAYPTNDFDPYFILSPNVTLPPAFGSAYVGETFACSLCANNEISDAMRASKKVSSVRILAEMQTPSQVFPLDLRPAANAVDEGQGHRLLQSDEAEHPLSPSLPPLPRTAGDELDYGQSLQKIVQFDLKEEGNHILAVSVSYTEIVLASTGQSENDHQYTAMSTQPASSGRVRTFRKLYQFIAQPCLSVRTKASELAPAEIENKSLGPYGKTRLLRFALEAQLENVGDGTVVIEKAILNPKPPFKAIDLNSDVSTDPAKETESERPTMNPRDILQVAFLVEQEVGQQEGLENLNKDLKRDGRATLGQLSIEWRSAMGDRGFLTTGNLLTKKR